MWRRWRQVSEAAAVAQVLCVGVYEGGVSAMAGASRASVVTRVSLVVCTRVLLRASASLGSNAVKAADISKAAAAAQVLCVDVNEDGVSAAAWVSRAGIVARVSLAACTCVVLRALASLGSNTAATTKDSERAAMAHVWCEDVDKGGVLTMTGALGVDEDGVLRTTGASRAGAAARVSVVTCTRVVLRASASLGSNTAAAAKVSKAAAAAQVSCVGVDEGGVSATAGASRVGTVVRVSLAACTCGVLRASALLGSNTATMVSGFRRCSGGAGLVCGRR